MSVLFQQERMFAGCSKRPFSKAAASEEARRTLRYVEDFDESRTKLADFFSILILSSFSFAVIKMPMLPVKPGMAKFVGKNVAPSRQG